MGVPWRVFGTHGSPIQPPGVVSMARKQRDPELFTLEQYIDPRYWTHAQTDSGFADGLQQLLAAAALPPSQNRIDALRVGAEWLGGYICSCWEQAGLEVSVAHAALHSDDERTVWSEVEQTKVTEPKPLHLHLSVRMVRGKSGSVDKLTQLAGVESQYLQLNKMRGGAAVEVAGQKLSLGHDNQLSYLVHAKDPEKYQYPPEQIGTVRGTLPYGAIYHERWDTWVMGRAHRKKQRAAESVEWLREQVLTGQISKGEILLTDEFFETYSRHMREIDDALLAYGQRRAAMAAARLERGDFETTIFFLHGQSGHGKTFAAKALLGRVLGMAAAAGQRWSVYRAATANPLDDYQGEELLFIDEARASTMDAQDWLLLLDPHNASPARARYRNKGAVAPRVVLITCTIEPVEFFFYTRQKGGLDEALDQFIRRLTSIVRAYRVDGDGTHRYDVGEVGMVPPYERSIESQPGGQKALTAGPGYTTLTMHYGVPEQIPHTLDGLIGRAAVAVAERSPDVSLRVDPELQAYVTAANSERARHVAELEDAAAAQEAKAAAEEAQIQAALDAANGDFFVLQQNVDPQLWWRAERAALELGWELSVRDKALLAQHTFGHIGMPPHVINPAHINSN